ncbi:TonB-dependent receptor [Edaphobacter acidisoli]|nr:carboxypeptidase-like regulatory domain-containing protein [Edaphobacter acidisoli]
MTMYCNEHHVPSGMPRARSFVFLAAVLAAVVMFFTLPAKAQLAGKGAINGVVTDPTGAVVSNATIVVTSTTRGTSVTAKSNNSGDYSVSPLDADIYTVTVTAQGFQQIKQENVHVNSLEVATVNISLQVGTESQSVTVSSAPPALETSNATLGATMEQEMYSALPIQMGAYGQPDQRRATDFALLMPGVQGNETNGNATTNTGVVNGSGSRGAASAVYINGIPFTQASGEGDPRFVWTAISVDAVNQFQVQTSGYSALYEGQGVQNYTVKQGGNKYHGAVYEYFRNTALDTWGFFQATSPVTGLPIKPVEHQNEYGIALSGPLVPLGSWKDKLFFFGNYNGFRYASAKPTAVSFPTVAQQNGDFSAAGANIYDPSTQASCTANSTTGPCRYQYGFGPGSGSGPAGNPVVIGPKNVIPAGEFSQIALKMQSYIPTLANQNPQNNYIAANPSGLSNWSTTDRIDYMLSSKNTLTMTAAIGRQGSSVPVGQTTAGRNTAGLPYNYSQAYAPKTAVGIIEDTHVFSPNVVNQFKYGFARYNGPTINADQNAAYAASVMGITNLPAGQAQEAFPITTFSGTNAPTQWAGTTASAAIANSYTLLDNVQWVKGNHSVTIGGQIAWLQYQTLSANSGVTPLTLANAVTETAAITPSSNSSPKYAATSGTGLAYASFLVGQIDKASFTQYLVPEYGARFRAISPYIQDDWKVNSRLTVNLGLRYDFYPSYREAHNNVSFFNPTLTNPITNLPGAIQYGGTGANTCNCSTPVNNFYKNIGPRIGLAFQSDPKTVWRASYGVMYTHGNGVGGAANSRTGTGTLGFSAAPSFSANGFLLSTAPLGPGQTAIPSFSPALGRASGNGYGTGYTTVSGYTGTPSGVGYADPYLGGRAPQYINWSFGFQHQWTSSFTSSINYVGSEGHFLVTDGGNPRGYWSNQLDPKYLSLNSNLSLTGSSRDAYCIANSLPCAPAGLFTSSQSLGSELKPFPFYGVSDTYGNVANSIYHGLQVSLMKAPSHGLTFMLNYTWSRGIDDGGTFRTGYDIPAQFAMDGKFHKADSIERTVSTSNQPHHVVLTAVWDMPFGKTILASNEWQRAVFGGFKFSGIFQANSGSPLALTGSACGTNPAQSTCEPSYNPAFSGKARINGAWGDGVTAANTKINFIDPNTFIQTPAYMFGDAPRTAPYNIYGPGNYDVDISLRRSFALHLSEASRLSLQADMYNVTNHTQFGGIGTTFGSSNFGQVSNQTNQSRDVQLSGRLEF